MTLNILYAGFDWWVTDGALANGDQTTDPSVNSIGLSGAGRHGGRALRADSAYGTSYVEVTRFEAGTDWGTGCAAFALGSSGAWPSADLILALYSSGFDDVALVHGGGGTLQIWKHLFDGGTAVKVAEVAGALTAPETFDYINFHVHVSSGTGVSDGHCIVRVNGAAIMRYDGLVLTGAANINMGYVDFIAHGSGTSDLLIDDFVLLYGNDAEPVPNRFLQDAEVYMVRPNGGGTYTGFSLGAGSSNWQANSETDPDGNTSYVHTAAVSTKDTYTMDNLPTHPYPIVRLTPQIWTAADSNSDSFSAAAYMRFGGTDNTPGASFSLFNSTSYRWYVLAVYSNNPNTSLPFTDSDVNGMEAGFQLTANGGAHDFRVSNLIVQILTIPGVSTMRPQAQMIG